MTAEQLDSIEEALGFPLPVEYRRVAASRPFRPIGSQSIYWFFDDPEAVIGETLRPQESAERGLPRLPVGCLAIGFSACGDTYVLDARTGDLPVAFVCHETHEVVPAYPSFAAFVADYLAAPEQIQKAIDAAAAEAQAVSRARNRRAGAIVLLGSLPFLALLILMGVIAWYNG